MAQSLASSQTFYHLLMIPLGLDSSKPHHVAKVTHFKDAIDK
jgi:hypothetical protein